MKICKICKIEKESIEFSKRKNDTYRNECKECKRKYAIEYRKGNKDNKFKINKSKIVKICNTCDTEKPISEFPKNKRICFICRSEYDRKYYNENREIKLKKLNEFYIKNRENIKIKNSNYSKNNRDIINKRNKRYIKNRRKDPIIKLKERISNGIRRSLKLKNIPKKFKSQSILGCDFISFKNYIESKFLTNMSWENMDKWHIDHIVPISVAINEEEVILLNNYENLQPMWSSDNIRKNNFIDINNPIYIKIIENRIN